MSNQSNSAQQASDAPTTVVPSPELFELLRAAQDLCEYGSGDTHRRDRLRKAGKAFDAARELTAAQGVGYGIIDPDYARIYTIARVLAWSEGYALTMHGSFTRDLDLVAVPWTENAREPEHLARRVLETCGLKDTASNPGQKPHGRLVWTMRLPDFGDPRFVDFSVMPALSQPIEPQGAVVVTDEMVNVALDGFNEAAADGELFLTSHRDMARMKFALRDALATLPVAVSAKEDDV